MIIGKRNTSIWL